MCKSSKSGAMALNMAEVQLNRQLSEQPRRYSLELRESDDSDFEFDHSHTYSNEPPPSPKVHNFSPRWQRGMVSTTHPSQAEHIHTAAPIFQHFHVVDALHHGSDTILQSPDRYRHKISTTEELEDHMLDAAVMSISPDQREKERPNLRSLMLKSKTLEQLPLFVAAYQSIGAPNRQNIDQETVRSCSSSSSSDTSSSTSTSVSFSSSSPTSLQHHKRKSRRWSNLLKLDFLHSKDKASTKDIPSTTKSVNPPHNRAVYCAPAVHHDEAEIGDGKAVSSKQSTGSLSSMYSKGSSAVKEEKEIGRQESSSASAPVSPAASPSRAPLSAQLGPGAHLNGRRPAGSAMSPHAQHYQQQRARAEEARRRTFLPYRHSLPIGAPSRSRLPQVAY
ncbi:hypothetical protein L7F22_067208 [Adiantum nelumboides]|nr:hypothetical protein [Adiantum nelumboides]